MLEKKIWKTYSDDIPLYFNKVDFVTLSLVVTLKGINTYQAGNYILRGSPEYFKILQV